MGRKGQSRSRSRARQSPGARRSPDAPGSTRSTRAERIAAQRRAVRRRQLRTRILIVTVVVIGLAAFGLNLLANRQSDRRLEAALTSGSCRVDRTSDRDSGTGRNHVPSPTFEVDPPAGGDHTAQAASAGEFSDANAPGDGQIVHALEHGYVTLWYRPDIPVETVERLREVKVEFERDVLLLPRATLPVPVAATAWHRRLLCDAAEPEVLRRFVRAYRNKGPERVPH